MNRDDYEEDRTLDGVAKYDLTGKLGEDSRPASCSANDIDGPWYESEDCENCVESAEEEGIDYEHNMTWENGAWTCDHCGSVQ